MAARGGAARAAPVAALLVAALLLGACAPASASSYPARVVSGFLSNAASAVVKRLWSLKSTTKTAANGGKSMVKYEGGYTVETVFDGSKLGVEPYSVEVTQGGELLVMDSMNSNIYRMALPLSRYSRPKLVAGSPEGFPGHVDGKVREARMNHPKGFTVDDRGNIYVADAMNMAIRKISDTGVTTIAGGKSGRGGHVDGPSDEAKFSTDFEVRYIGSSCSLLVIDRGNQAIREIQLHFDDCVYQYEAGFPLGVALLLAAAFFGYMLALLQRRALGMYSNGDVYHPTCILLALYIVLNANFTMQEQEALSPVKAKLSSIPPPYQKPLKPSLRPPLIPNENEPVKQEEEEGLFTSIGKLVGGAKSSIAEVVGAAFSRKKHVNIHHHQMGRPTSWPVQESYAIPRDETPPPLDTRTPTPRKNYAFMSKEPEKIHHIRHGRPQLHGWTGEAPQQQQQPPPPQQVHHQQYLQHHRQYSSGPQTFYEPSCEATNEIVFGAVQEVDTSRRAMETKAVNHADAPPYEQNGLRYRSNYTMGCSGNN
ncbi:hypothetical protein BAE44_0003219 [Dichanthelium oligosanthes]|uniref:NHL repeat-containing protein 2 n=1 Tax=Dichanthelium oligosanthes TaxID=888268 RepID=A0A1E5WEH0_9POAL|nr:hypothetical protein BAE44_0003219 [Dichanthelium oligosanthes]